ncbi:MAG: glycoside hydrolase family 13 protein [Clostridia bacterium]|nr:glycoside hydrolase family 13 protein [Clostridia bacterium]
MIYNPLDINYKSIVGAVPNNTKIKFRVNNIFDSVIFVVQKEFEQVCKYQMTRIGDYFELELSFSSGLYFYYFELDNGKYISLSNNYDGEISSEIVKFQLSVYDSKFETPDWIKGGVIYQIFPDRFNRSNREIPKINGRVYHNNVSDVPIYKPDEKGEVLNNDFFCGDIQGIISKLDYLKELNVSVIYLNPIFEAYSNHRYDTANYMKIDSLLGTEEDFKELVNKAQENGIKIVLDGVFNHTGSDSIYFNKKGTYDVIGAYQSEKSPYVSWFDFISYPDNYNSWWGIKTLPAVNKSEDSPFIDYICGEDGVLEHYTKLGIGGWRLDVVDELPAHFVKRIRKAVKRVNKEAVVIGEVWEDASNKIAYGKRREYFLGGELDAAMNYPLKNAIVAFVKNGDSKALSNTVKQLTDHYPKKVLNCLMNLLSTHDTFRLLSNLSSVSVDGYSKEQMENLKISKNEWDKVIFRLKIATLLQFTLPGVPSVYYGDEIGMQGYKDPLNRMFFDWDNINYEILSWYKKISQFRSERKLFENGNYREVYANNGTLIYKIENEQDEIMVLINLSKNFVKLEIVGRVKEYFSNEIIEKEYVLKPNTFAIFLVE